QDGTEIGRVLMATGDVQATSPSGDTRTLTRGAFVYPQDRIVVGLNANVQFRMVDGAQLSLRPNTEFTFQEYSYDGPGGAGDTALMEMVRGGFRTISGQISEDDADTYQITTPLASIGIRGTTHEGVIVGGILYTGVYDGAT